MEDCSNSNSNSNGHAASLETKIHVGSNGDSEDCQQQSYTHLYRMSKSSFGSLKTSRLPLRFAHGKRSNGVRCPDRFRIKKKSFTNGKYYLYCDEDSSDYDESDGDDNPIHADEEIILKVHVNNHDGNIEEEVVERICHGIRLKRKKNIAVRTSLVCESPSDDIELIGVETDQLVQIGGTLVEQCIVTDGNDRDVSKEAPLISSLLVDNKNVSEAEKQQPIQVRSSPTHSRPISSRMSSRIQSMVAVDYTKFLGKISRRGMKKKRKSPCDNPTDGDTPIDNQSKRKMIS